ncbi:putative nitrate assimilation regulatory protein nirA [Metarhizium acridum CQMa 102]|uniref:Putative nitrate assimilation regulatory protein nirA n=1 Tax=Metarhizium acridum (strain CQMa 102) TaxID=655827 RepID=E9EAJ4_METAQ|nr:putative nitrate assimilation regulatory protein nirA [Metarhizium acridum CQMa 102]EFY87103.1 putative nitrate assimilation regulatory protein nirA [Metarhizium acridum CQMa 102]
MSDHEFGATVQKIVGEILPPHGGVAFAKEARDLLIECCVEFITLISSEANEISEKEAKKTIACDHITKALEQLGFSDYVPAVLEAAAEHKEVQKCDGNWPKCSTCRTKKRACGYVGREGQSRATAVKSRLESLEELVTALKTSSPEQLATILNSIRDADDAVGAIESLASQTGGLNGQDQQYALLLLANKLTCDLRLLLPEAPVVMRAVNSFFSCSGKLFHVFSEPYILQCYRAIFDESQPPSELLKAKVCCLAAVAAVGAQYAPDTISKEVEAALYNLARHFLEVAIEHEPLHAIKACTLFAQYNIMNKEMVSLTWLSSTLGYISGNTWSAEKRVLADLRFDDADNITEVVQTEMARICLLKAEILRMHLVFKDLTIPAVETIRGDLQSWYEELPESMRLGAPAHENLPVGTKRSILHLHMLYLGAIMLLYRRVATQFLQSFAVGGLNGSLHLHPREAFVQQSAEAVLAASTSSRIVKLLLDDGGVFKHCWLVIFQTYTACTILLHSVVQKQLHSFEPSRWQDDLDRAEDCLTVLGFCGSQDRIAEQFHAQLEAIFQTASAHVFRGESDEAFMETDVRPDNPFPPMDDVGEANHAYLLDIPPGADDSLVKLSFILLMMLGQPFGDRDTKEAAEVNLKEHWLTDPSRYEFPQMAERVDWNIENRRMFQWDLSKLNIPPFEAMKMAGESSSSEDASDLGLSDSMSAGTFLGSSEPSGWTSAANLTSQVRNNENMLGK